MPSTTPVAAKHAVDRALLLTWLLVLGVLTATTVDGCDRRREDGHCNYHVGIVTVNSSSNETVNWTVPADLTVYGVRLLWIEGSVTDDATVATGNSTFGDPVDGSSLTMFTTNASDPIVPNATFDSNVNLLSFTAPPSFYYNLTHGENISSVTNLTLKCPPTFLPEGTVLRLWNSDAISRGNNAGAPKYSWSLITNFATNTSSQTTSRSNPSASQSRSVPSMTLSKSAEMASQTRTRTFTALYQTRTRSRSVARTESKTVSRTAPTRSGTNEHTGTRTITPKFRTNTRTKTLQLPGFLGTVASGCSQMLQEGQLIYTSIMQLTTMPRRPPMCSAVYSYLATFQPSPSGPDATQRQYARTVLSIDPQPAIDAYLLTLPAALKQCPSCGAAATAVTQSCAAANSSVIRAVVSTQAKLMYPRCFATGTMTPGLTLSHTATRRVPPTATRTLTLPVPTTPPPPTTTTAVPVTTATPVPTTTTAAPMSTLSPPISTSSGNSTDAPSTAAPMPSTPSPTDLTPEPPSSVSPPTTTSGNLTTSPASTAEVTSTAPATTAPPPVTMIPTTAPPTQAPTMAPVTTVAPTPPPPTVYSPGALIQFTATVTLNSDGTINMAEFTRQLAVLLGVGESNIAPVLSGVNAANGTATVAIYFVGDERDKLQNKMAGLTSTQLATVGITSLGAAPAAIGTASPPSNDLARAGGDVWIIGVGLLGALAVVGGVIFVLLRRHRARLVAKVDVHNWDEEQLITVAGPALNVPPRGSGDAPFQL